MVKTGRLYGLGVGPGDPELMTVKAWRIVSTAPVIAYLAANGGQSIARAIAAPFISSDAIELAIDMPMQGGREPAHAAYDRGCASIAEQLRAGRDVAMLCEGDPFFYGSFINVFARLARDYPTVVVPGVSSISAAGAAAGRPLAARNEILKILPATLDAALLRDELNSGQSAAIIKVGRHIGKLRDVLSDLGLTQSAIVVEKVTQAEQRIRKLADVGDESLPYFTTVLIYSGAEPR